MHKFENSILREYDIRGVFKETLTELDAYNLGCAVAGWFAKLGRFNPKIVVCFDGRLSSPVLAENLYGGLLDSGCEVIRVGRGPTPMLYYAAQHLACDGGIMVTGSHNPPNFNGFKLVIDGKPFYGESIIELGNIAESGNYVFGNGNISSEDIMDQYINSLL